MLKKDFTRFLKADTDRLHVAAHSHHFWPDVTFAAQQQCWEDAALLADRKWERVMTVLADVQQHIAHTIKVDQPDNIAFAVNTHEFVLRLLSCLPQNKKPVILTTDSEFHSFCRQMDRLEEAGLVETVRVPVDPFDSFGERFASAAAMMDVDMVFFSQVFFNSGYVVSDITQIVNSIPDNDTLVVIDGYHGFMAVPTDLSALQKRVFYVSGGYKYAMSGEGVCFLYCPDGYGDRPVNTGWFADFEHLEQETDSVVGYPQNGFRFMGATFDPVGLYRMKAVFDWLKKEKVDVAMIRQHVKKLQEMFLNDNPLKVDPVVPVQDCGNFLTFDLTNAADIHKQLMQENIITDVRGSRLRFGFGVYHDESDIETLIKKVKNNVG